jgi:hypothetical protein
MGKANHRAKLRSVPSKWRMRQGGGTWTEEVLDNLGPVEVPFLSPRCRGDARSPRSRLILNTVKRERKAVTLHPPANPAEHRCVGVGTRTHVCIVVMWGKPTWVIGLVQNGHGETRGLPPLRLDNSSLDPDCLPEVSRRTVRPYAPRPTAPRNGVTPPPALPW